MGRHYCVNCVEYRLEDPRFSKQGHASNDEVPVCMYCESRYKDLELKLKRLQIDHKDQKESSEAALDEQKTAFENALSKLRLIHTSELDQIRAENKTEHNKAIYLTVPRERLPGDVCFGIQDLQIFAHKTILAARSDVFQKMVVRGTLEKPSELIQLVGASHPVMEAVISFCYSGEICFGESVPPDQVLKVAHHFKIECLKNVCDAELCGRISMDNLPQMLRLCRTFCARELQEEADKFFKEHFDSLKTRVYETLEDVDLFMADYIGAVKVVGGARNNKKTRKI